MVLAASSASTIGYSCDQTHSSCWSWASKRSAALPRTGWPAPGFSLSVTRVFFFFSNRSGCLRSLLISAAVTAVVLLVLRFL